MVVFLSRTASGHLVDLSMMVRRCVYPSREGGRGPTMSHNYLGPVAHSTLFAPGHHISCQARPVKAGSHQPPSGSPPNVVEPVDGSNTVLLWEAGNKGLRAPVEVSHQRLAPTISSSKSVLPVSTSWVSWQVSWLRVSSPHLIGSCCVAGTTAAVVEARSSHPVPASDPEGTFTLAT